MTVVYIDSLFLLNFIVDYLLLLATAKLAGEVICRARLAPVSYTHLGRSRVGRLRRLSDAGAHPF